MIWVRAILYSEAANNFIDANDAEMLRLPRSNCYASSDLLLLITPHSLRRSLNLCPHGFHALRIHVVLCVKVIVCSSCVVIAVFA